MKIYLTKPPHTKYGRIKLNTYQTIDELVDDSTFWFDKPKFKKPFICVFTEELAWDGFSNLYHCSGKIKNFPEGPVKEAMKTLIKNTIREDFYETFSNRHYKWIGEIEVDLVSSTTTGNFNLYLTKPDAVDIHVAGIDRATIWFHKPKLKRELIDLYESNKFNYHLEGQSGIKGVYFRKFQKELCQMFWNDIVNSFDIQFDNMTEFYTKINNKNHKKGQSSKKFVKEYYFNLLLRGDI